MKILDRADMSKGILIVDDNEDVVFAYDRYLRRKGFAYNSEGKLYQREGSRNALGIVKFLFPNKYSNFLIL